MKKSTFICTSCTREAHANFKDNERSLHQYDVKRLAGTLSLNITALRANNKKKLE